MIFACKYLIKFQYEYILVFFNENKKTLLIIYLLNFNNSEKKN